MKKQPQAQNRTGVPDGTMIWRYFDFAKFVSLIDRNELFFSAASSLQDPFEGLWPQEGRLCEGASADEEPSAHLKRDLVAINSWHMNPDESFAMWRLYSSSWEAIAIRSTLGRLKRALKPRADQCELRIGEVKYLDYRMDRLEPSDLLGPFFCKSRPFSYESEVRAVADLYGRHVQGRSLTDRQIRTHPVLGQILRDKGHYVPVSLEELIEELYVSPSAAEWFLDLVHAILKRYELDFKPRHSVLSQAMGEEKDREAG